MQGVLLWKVASNLVDIIIMCHIIDNHWHGTEFS